MAHAVTAIRVDCENLRRGSVARIAACVDFVFVEPDPRVAKSLPLTGTAVQQHTFKYVQLQV
jgi:hypothetical protein